jgi:hypothetical protein
VLRLLELVENEKGEGEASGGCGRKDAQGDQGVGA